MKPRVYAYKKRPAPPDMALNRIRKTGEDEVLSGFVQGQEASSLEERFARALDSSGLRYRFQLYISTPFQIPGQRNMIDFVIEEAGTHPVEVDGTWVHKTAGKRAEDALRDAILDDLLGRYGWNKIIRVPGTKLESQDLANKAVKEMFL